MSDTLSPQKVIRFGEFEVDLRAGCLFKQGVKLRLREQVFVALSVLLEYAGEVVTREELQRRLMPGEVFVDFELNLNTAEERTLLESLHMIASQAYMPPTSFAWIHLAPGDIDSILDWMDCAIDARDTVIILIKRYPFLDLLRADSRFHALLRKMNLEP
jgi:hypothetical protein